MDGTQQLLPSQQVEERILRRKFIFKHGSIGILVGSLIGLAIPFIIVGILHLLGFGTKGIVPGSIAAEIEANMGHIPKGSWFACK